MTDNNTMKSVVTGYRVVYGLFWIGFLVLVSNMMPNWWTALAAIVLAYCLASLRGLVIFNGMKGDVMGLVETTEIMIASSKQRIEMLEKKVADLTAAKQ